MTLPSGRRVEDADRDPGIVAELAVLPVLPPLRSRYSAAIVRGVPDQQETSMTQSTEINVPEGTIRPTIELLGHDGNAFAVLGTVRRALRNAGNDPAVYEAYMEQAMSGNYDHLLQVTTAFCEVE